MRMRSRVARSWQVGTRSPYASYARYDIIFHSFGFYTVDLYSVFRACSSSILWHVASSRRLWSLTMSRTSWSSMRRVSSILILYICYIDWFILYLCLFSGHVDLLGRVKMLHLRYVNLEKLLKGIKCALSLPNYLKHIKKLCISHMILAEYLR